MAVLSHDEQVRHWQRVLASTGDERRAMVATLGAFSLGEAAKAVDLYHDEDGVCARTFLVIDAAGHLGALAAAFTREGPAEVVAEDAVASVVAALHDAANELEGDASDEAATLVEDWRRTVYDRVDREPEWLKVAEVATIYGITPQAVYKWIQAGKIEAEQTPGGSYRIPAATLRTSRENEQRIDRLRERLGERTDQSLSEDEIMQRVAQVRRRSDA